MTAKMVSVLLYVNVMQLSWRWKWHCSLYLSQFLFLSFTPSLTKIDISSRWVRMIESWLLLKMKIFADDTVVHEGFLKCSRKCSLSPTQSGWAFHPPVQLTSTTQRLSKNSIWLRPDQVWKSEGWVVREWGRQGGREYQRHEISSVSSTHLLYHCQTSQWHLTTQHLLLIMLAHVSLSFTPRTIIYFCTLFLFYLSITLDICGSVKLLLIGQ